MGKATLLVLDGFGVGAMADCRETKPEDIHASTYAHLQETVGLNLPTLMKMGLGKIVNNEGEAIAAYGKSKLAHHGADTFMGHQELMGSKPGKPAKRLMKEIGQQIADGLTANGYHVEELIEGKPILLVDGAVVVGDNLESALGNIINMTADLTQISFEAATKMAAVVRKHVDTSRVIVFGNESVPLTDIVAAAEEGKPGQWGINAPKTGVYGEGYQVLHLGYGVTFEKQFAFLAEQAGKPVYRIGKTADVIQAQGFANPVVHTPELLSIYKKMYNEAEEDAVFLVNVQETDLAGHKEDPSWYKEVLETVDHFLAQFLPTLAEHDLLIVTADHGNDPTCGHSQHTREHTPILAYGKQVQPVCLGVRDTMADIAATLSDFTGVQTPEFGTSFLPELTGK
ncbi:phosphopentomutase [Shouchella clausii]|uniref:phosphopentomutase n=1 Tax=Shouchella clausii TaxID=79880 RepID=UPI000BA64966|nr:phosphopentomutase [Shouchella clausii]PAF13988.1 phosphopentomutase [Shouchella clausii]